MRVLTDEDVAARKRMKEAAILPEGALSLAQVRNQCNPRIGQWACFTRWPGGWLPFDNPIVRAHPDVWKGPTEYAKFLPECFGFTGAPWQLIGHYVKIGRAHV